MIDDESIPPWTFDMTTPREGEIRIGVEVSKERAGVILDASFATELGELLRRHGLELLSIKG